jgi:CRISPR/Cas system CSM-associated protein Csm3 (group 7 of RAMP superfamily)
MVNGDAVKGAFRMSSEHILQWMELAGQSSRLDLDRKARDRLYRTPGKAIFRSARFDSTPATENLMQTAIDGDTGVARENSLRRIEVTSKGAELSSSAILWLEDFEVQATIGFFIRSLAGIETLGGMTSSGKGRVRVTALSATLDGHAVNPSDLFSHAPDPSPFPEPACIDRAGGGWHRCIITLLEDTCVGAKPDTSNKTVTQDYIPATTLRGAFRAAWIRQGIPPEIIDSLLGPASRWLPAYPALKSPKEGSTESSPGIFVPVPASYIVPKGNSGLTGVFDTLSERKPDETRQWRKSPARWMSPLQTSTKSVARQLPMHSARDYRTGSKVESALFSREHIDSSGTDATFISWIFTDSALPVPRRLSIGKRKSASHGLADVRIEKVVGPPTWDADSQGEKTPEAVYVQLMSPAIVRGVWGYPVRGLDAALWEHILGNNVKIARCMARSGSSEIPAWISPWGHGRAPVCCIDAGSVWKLVPEKPESVQQLRDACRVLEHNGAGERRHEGYGWIAVDPPWLGITSSPESAQNADSKSDHPKDTDRRHCAGQSLPDDAPMPQRSASLGWPGNSGTPQHLLALLQKSESFFRIFGDLSPEKRNRIHGYLKELLSIARGPDAKAKSVAEHLRERLAGENSKWKDVWPDAALRYLEGIEKPDDIRFLLDVLSIKNEKELP